MKLKPRTGKQALYIFHGVSGMKKYIALVFLFVASVSFAHLEGESAVIGDYKIELSTIPEELMIGVNSDVVISIENATSGERIRGAAFWARLSLNDTTVLSSSDFITNGFGSSGINYIFQKPGHYRLDITPALSNATATFHLRVLEEYKADSAPLYMAAAAAVFFIIGIAVGFIFSRRMGK